MKKEELIEELKKEIETTKNVLNCEEHFNLYAKGKRVGLEFGWMFAEKLDEPELPVIPQFVADWIEYQKTGRNPLLWAVSEGSKREAIADWLFPDNYREKVNREDLLLRAWLDGYTIEKETMYYVIFLESEDKEYGQALYKDFNFSGDKVVSTHIETFSKRISLEAGNFHFTEQEIKSIDERYWAFAEEVSE